MVHRKGAGMNRAFSAGIDCTNSWGVAPGLNDVAPLALKRSGLQTRWAHRSRARVPVWQAAWGAAALFFEVAIKRGSQFGARAK